MCDCATAPPNDHPTITGCSSPSRTASRSRLHRRAWPSVSAATSCSSARSVCDVPWPRRSNATTRYRPVSSGSASWCSHTRDDWANPCTNSSGCAAGSPASTTCRATPSAVVTVRSRMVDIRGVSSERVDEVQPELLHELLGLGVQPGQLAREHEDAHGDEHRAGDRGDDDVVVAQPPEGRCRAVEGDGGGEERDGQAE